MSGFAGRHRNHFSAPPNAAEIIDHGWAQIATDTEEPICPLIARISADGLQYDPRPSASSTENSALDFLALDRNVAASASEWTIHHSLVLAATEKI